MICRIELGIEGITKSKLYEAIRNYLVEKDWLKDSNKFELVALCTIPETYVEGVNRSVGMIDYLLRINIQKDKIIVDAEVPAYIDSEWARERVFMFVNKHIHRALAY